MNQEPTDKSTLLAGVKEILPEVEAVYKDLRPHPDARLDAGGNQGKRDSGRGDHQIERAHLI